VLFFVEMRYKMQKFLLIGTDLWIFGMVEWQNGGMAEWQNGRMAEWEWRNSGIAEGRNGGNS
jgi:hypothetical protein